MAGKPRSKFNLLYLSGYHAGLLDNPVLARTRQWCLTLHYTLEYGCGIACAVVRERS